MEPVRPVLLAAARAGTQAHAKAGTGAGRAARCVQARGKNCFYFLPTKILKNKLYTFQKFGGRGWGGWGSEG